MARLAAKALHPAPEGPLPLPDAAPYGAVLVDQGFHPGYRVPGLLHHTAQVQERVVRELGLVEHGLQWCRPADIWAPGPKGGAWLRGNGTVEGDIAAQHRYLANHGWRVQRADRPKHAPVAGDPELATAGLLVAGK